MRAPDVTLPDVTLAVIEGLRADALLSGVTVTHRPVEDHPSEFVRVFRTGGTAEGVVDRAQITIEAWATTDKRAHDLGQLARRAARRLVGTKPTGHFISRVTEISGLALLPDQLSRQSRHTFSVIVTVRGY